MAAKLPSSLKGLSNLGSLWPRDLTGHLFDNPDRNCALSTTPVQKFDSTTYGPPGLFMCIQTKERDPSIGYRQLEDPRKSYSCISSLVFIEFLPVLFIGRTQEALANSKVPSLFLGSISNNHGHRTETGETHGRRQLPSASHGAAAHPLSYSVQRTRRLNSGMGTSFPRPCTLRLKLLMGEARNMQRQISFPFLAL